MFFLLCLQFGYLLCRPPFYSLGCHNVPCELAHRPATLDGRAQRYPYEKGSQDASEPAFLLQKHGGPRTLQHDPGGEQAELNSQRMDGGREPYAAFYSDEGPVSSAASVGPWGPSILSSFTYLSDLIGRRRRRTTLTRYNPGRTLPQVQSVTNPSAFGVKFHKCAQVKAGTDLPQLTFFLRIHNMGPVGGTNLSQVAIRDSVSGIVLLETEGKVVEKGYQTFAFDSLPAGSQRVVNYTAHIKGHKSEVLDLPAFLTFSNASQNDVSMFGPLMANLTLRVNSTDRIYPNHSVQFAGFAGGFVVTLVLLSLGFLALNLICARARMSALQPRRNRGVSDPEYAECNLSETTKDEAAFEDKMVDIMVLEDPQNMYQALENLEMSSLLRASSGLEATRVQIYKDLTASLLGSLRSQGQASAQARQRLLSVLHGQLLGMEGRLKEERVARMAALAGQCNLETREEMEVEHRREAAEKARAELLCQRADQQELLECSVLLEKLHKLNQSRLQCTLLVRHEQASARVQRQMAEWRRVELHKIFSEELEEATRMGELDKSTAKTLLHDYFTCQDQLEEVLDVVLANQRRTLAERHAQRKFLVHSLHSLKGLISDTFANSSSNLDVWFTHVRRGSAVPGEQIDQVQDKAQKELVRVKQGLDEALSQERRAMHCGLVKKRRELISDMLQAQRQRQKELWALSRDVEERVEASQHLCCWQSLLTAQSLELAELINSLDEEAAADIRKVTMRVIQSAMADVKAIQPSAVQALLALLPPGAPRSLLQADQDPAQGASALTQAQERLHQEGKAAVRTLRSTREALQESMERELQEQRELRAQARAFFRCLCSSQLTLSEDDVLRMKLEFQQCVSAMDRCLVLPHALCRVKLHSALAAWRRDAEQQAQLSQRKPPSSKRKPGESRAKTDPSDLLSFQRRLEDRIQLFEREKEMESSIMEEVLEEMRRERADELRSQAGSLATQMAALHYQKAERRSKVLETSRALLALHSLLTQQLREGKGLLGGPDVAQSIQSHCSGLEEADQQLQRERTELECLETAKQPRTKAARDPDSEEEEDKEEERLFQVQRDYRMATILQEALSKRSRVSTLMAERLQEWTARRQAMEDLKEQLELKRLYATCDQDLEFASRLVKQSDVSTEVLLEALRLLLPTLPESELLAVVDALCPKQPPLSPSAEQDLSGCVGGARRTLLIKLREDMVQRNVPSSTVDKDRSRLLEMRQSLVDKLFPSPRPEAPPPGDVVPVLVQEKGRDGGAGPTDAQPRALQPAAPGLQEPTGGEAFEGLSTAPATSSGSAGSAPGVTGSGGRLFVFRVPPETQDTAAAPRRKRKRNFLNLNKGSVAPTQIP